MRAFLIGFCVGCGFVLGSGPAFGADGVVEAKGRLDRQLQLIKFIEPYVDRPNLARLYVLRSSSNNVLKSIEDNGPLHKATFQEYQKLIVAYRFSVAFFKQIETEDTAQAISELQKINEDIVVAYGFDDSPYTQITLSVFSQMEKLLTQLSRLSLSDQLKIKVSNVMPVLGEVIAKAKSEGGDTRPIYPVSERGYRAIEKLYPDFNRLAASDSAFEITLEIQGLNEFYAEFARLHSSAE
ncbi:MAG: hypothetical protein HYR96_09630 [Deltaproteobacteria bacterium]|nr:hypothetical protein [Deltaproteobacteria bacterium]